MRSWRDDFGPLTQLKIDKLRQIIFDKETHRINHAQSKGEFGFDMWTEIAAPYFDAHNGGVMRMQKMKVSAKMS